MCVLVSSSRVARRCDALLRHAIWIGYPDSLSGGYISAQVTGGYPIQISYPPTPPSSEQEEERMRHMRPALSVVRCDSDPMPSPRSASSSSTSASASASASDCADSDDGVEVEEEEEVEEMEEEAARARAWWGVVEEEVEEEE